MPREKYIMDGIPFRNYYVSCPHCKKYIIAWEDNAVCPECQEPVCPECLFPIVKWHVVEGGNSDGNWYRVECPRCEYAIIDY